MVLSWWANREGKVVIGTLPDSDDMRHQVRRETFADVLALEAAALEVDLSEATVILRNDAVGALTALRKGSFFSTFLQQCTMRSCRLQPRVGFNTLHLHAPGRVFVATLDPGLPRWLGKSAATLSGPTPVSSPPSAAGP